jgi:5-methylcytosine-specific restriction endonuclease McrA
MDIDRLEELTRRAEAENAAIRSALDALAASVMLALKAALEKLDQSDADLRKARLMVAAMKTQQVPDSLRRKIIRRDRMTCQYCGGCGDQERGPDGRPWHIDHVIPLVNGGLTHTGNLTLACSTCNDQKQGRAACEFVRYVANRARQSAMLDSVTSVQAAPRKAKIIPLRREPLGEGSRLRFRYTVDERYEAFIVAGRRKTVACRALYGYSDPIVLMLMSEAVVAREPESAIESSDADTPQPSKGEIAA